MYKELLFKINGISFWYGSNKMFEENNTKKHVNIG